MNTKKGIFISLLLVVGLLFAALPGGSVKADGSTIYVGILAPSWTALGGGGVFSAYVGPTAYGFVSPGDTALYDGREAGIIKAGINIDPADNNYQDEGLFAFKPTVTIDTFATETLTYDVNTEAGVNPVWMTIEIDTGIVGDRNDNTIYQHVPTSNPAGWHIVDPASGLWQKWNNGMGDVSGNPLISLVTVASENTGLDVVRAYLRLGMGNSYNNGGTGTIAWVDQVSLGGDTYDFVVIPSTLCTTDCYIDSAYGSDTFPGTPAFPLKTIQKGINTVAAGGTVHVTDGTYDMTSEGADPGQQGLINIYKQVTVKAKEDGNIVRPIIDATGVDGVFKIHANLLSGGEIAIEGFDITGEPTTGIAITVMYCGGDPATKLVINDNLIHGMIGGINSWGSAAFCPGGTDYKIYGIEITGNDFYDLGYAGTYPGFGILLEGLSDWVEAGDTFAAVVEGNTFDDIYNGSGTDFGGGIAIEMPGASSPGPANVQIASNIFDDVAIDVGIFASDVSTAEIKDNDFSNAGYGVYSTSPNPVNASPNWWGSPCGPTTGQTVGDVVYSPWYADAAMTVLVSIGTDGEYVFSSDATTEMMNAVIACVEPGSTLTFEGDTYPGGLIIDKDNLTINLNGATISAGSPAFEIVGDDITINGPGTLAGDGLSAGVLVQAGADNFILDGVEITGWTDGVYVAGAVESLKIVNNWIHTNRESALEVVGTPTGVVTIQGNLFKENTGVAVVYGGSGTLDVTSNSWGLIGGPTDLATNVAFDPFNYYEIYFDTDPTTPAVEDFSRRVYVGQTFDVALKADAVNVYGLTFKFIYDPAKLVLNLTTFDSVWVGKCASVAVSAGSVEYRCNLVDPDVEWQGGTIATFNFTSLASGDAALDIFADETVSAGAVGGVKVWVNNAGYNDPSDPDRDLTDEIDGLLYTDEVGNFTGFIDLQGRPNDSGALFEVYDAASGGTVLTSATSASSGKYTTAVVPGLWMVDSTVDPAYTIPYYLLVDRALFLPTALTEKSLTDTPLTTLAQLLLLGGDADNNNVIDAFDAGCIGGAYGTAGNACGIDGLDDVNGDGIVNIYDLTLMGGNYYLLFSPWAP